MFNIIKKVCENISNGQLFVTIPRKSNIKKDDFVSIKKIEIKNGDE